MRGARQLNLLVQLTKPAALRGVSLGRYASTRTRQNQRTTDDDGGDFRPPWVYSGSRFLTYTTIPREAVPSPSTIAIVALTQSLLSSHTPLLRFPRRLGRARTYIYARELLAWPLSSRQPSPCVSCADGYRSIGKRFSLYLLKKLLSFEEAVDGRPAAPCHRRTRAHK